MDRHLRHVAARHRMVTDPAEVEAIAAAIAEHGVMAMDIEFVSEDRFIPELSLVQLAWGDIRAPEVALIDYLAVGQAGMAPIFALIERADIATLCHAARQDLGLLITRFGVRARGFFDTQIAALFAGCGEQVGYASLVRQLLGVELDKSSQYTDWLARPLSARQIDYACADVAHLPATCAALCARLEASRRLDWAHAESERLAAGATPPAEPESAYLEVKGWRGLDGPSLASLRALAAWRQRTALAKNRPLSWILPDKAMVALCRKGARSERDLLATRGVDRTTARRHGKSILAHIAAGAESDAPDAAPPAKKPLSARAALWASVATSLAAARALDAALPTHLLADRDSIEALAAWFDDGARGAEPDIPLLAGWRREVAGTALIAFLRGTERIAVSESSGGLALESRAEGADHDPDHDPDHDATRGS